MNIALKLTKNDTHIVYEQKILNKSLNKQISLEESKEDFLKKLGQYIRVLKIIFKFF